MLVSKAIGLVLSCQCGVGGPLYLCVVRVGESLRKLISIVLMFCDIVSKSSYHGYTESFGLIVSQQVIRWCHSVVDTKKTELCCKAYGNDLRVVIRKKAGRNAVRYDPTDVEDFRNIGQCCHSRQDSLGELEVTIHDSYDMLFFAYRFWK